MKKIYIIAEIGINHNGSLDIAKELIDAAINAGCDAVKFQKRTLTDVYSNEFLDSPRESPWGSTQRDQKEGLEFSETDYFEIDNYCKLKGIDWFASAWDVKSQLFLRKYNCKYNKIASAMIVHADLLECVAEEGKHTFISTGMSTVEDVENAVKIFRDNKCSFELMHCVSTYPMLDEDANLGRIKLLKERFNCDVGYSGHESGLAISCAASALGITSLERHLTLDRSMYGSDQSASIEPEGMSKLVVAVRKIEQCLSNPSLEPSQKEFSVAEKLRAHVPFEASR